MVKNLEDYLGIDWIGQGIGSKEKIDFSQSPQVLLPAGTLSNVGSATLIVAASNSLNTGKSDYTCTGTNDQVTINAAIAALPTGGGRVILLEGTYNLGGAVVIAHSNIILEGQGIATILKLANSINTDCIQLGDGANTYTNIQVKNLLVDGNMANNTSGNGINFKNGSNYCGVINCTIQNTANNNIIWASTSLYSIIEDNYLINTGTGGFNIYTGNSEQYGTIKNNYCFGGLGGAIEMNGSGNDLIEGNTIFTSGTGYGIYLYSQSNCINNIIYCSTNLSNIIYDSYGNNNIEGNYLYITANPTHAIYMGGKSIAQNNYIYVTTGNTAAVIGIYGTANQVNAIGNYLVFSTAQAHIGIELFGANSTFNENYIYASSPTTNSEGIVLSANSNANIINNTITNFDKGIDLAGSADIQCNNNYISGCNTGIYINGSQGNISNNFLYFITNDAIDGGTSISAFCRDCTICNNYIDTPGKNGISVSGTGNIVNNNRILSCGGASAGTYSAIFITDDGTHFASHNVCSGNNISGSNAKYGIRENSASDNSNIYTSNIVLDGSTAKISVQGLQSVQANNITA